LRDQAAALKLISLPEFADSNADESSLVNGPVIPNPGRRKPQYAPCKPNVSQLKYFQRAENYLKK
jgi:hypothetical protein